MNLLNEFTTNEVILLEQAGITVENKEYSNDEIKRCENKIGEFIMNHSMKTNEISELSNKYSRILSVLIRKE